MKKGLVFGLIAVLALVFVSGFAAVPNESESSSQTKPSGPVISTTPEPKATGSSYLLDNFEDGDMDKAPEWFSFDNAQLKVIKATKLYKGDLEIAEAVGSYALSIKGNTNSWYVGGIGSMLGLDATNYAGLSIDVYGNGEGSGKIKVELYDDDNGNKEIEVDSKWVPTVDDQWSYEIDVNWTGWKRLSIPFPSFVLANSGKGNGKLDLNQQNGSAGLVKLQLIFVANEESGEVNYSIDNLELSKN